MAEMRGMMSASGVEGAPNWPRATTAASVAVVSPWVAAERPEMAVVSSVVFIVRVKMSQTKATSSPKRRMMRAIMTSEGMGFLSGSTVEYHLDPKEAINPATDGRNKIKEPDAGNGMIGLAGLINTGTNLVVELGMHCP